MTPGSSATPQVKFLIVGMARSGTTVLQKMVSEFSSVWVPPETHFWRLAPTLSSRYSWPLDEAEAEDALEWLAATDTFRDLSLDRQVALDALDGDSFLWDLFAAVVAGLSPPEATVFGEKTPDHLLWAEHLLWAIPHLKVVALMREPREVLRSHRTVPWGISDPAVFSEKWVHLAKCVEDIQRLFTDRVVTLRYEDVVASPEETRALLARFLEIDEEVDEVPEHPNRLFPESEWWKKRSLGPVERVMDTWQKSLSEEDIATIEARCALEMEAWMYKPQSSSREARSLTPAARETRRSLRRVSNQLLPITAASVEEWNSTDVARMERWRTRAEDLQRERNALDNKLRLEMASRTALEGWKEQAVELQRSLSHLRDVNESTLHQLKQVEQRHQVAERQARAWKARSQELQVARERTDLHRLQAERRYRATAGKLRRLRARRWWRLAGVLANWKRQPWRLVRLVRDMWTTVLKPSDLPSGPDLRHLDARISRIQKNLGAGSPAEGLEAARREFDAGDYQKSLELLSQTPDEVRTSREGLMLANGCYVRMGELTAGLETLRRLTRQTADPKLRWQERFQAGRLIETDPRWLPDAGVTAPHTTPSARPRVIMHILKESLPYFERGYTMRSHTTLLSQRRAGFEPTVVTSLGFPRAQGFDSFPIREEIDGIPHHRLDLGPAYPLKEAPFDQLLSDQATLTAQLARNVRPALIQAGSGYRGYETALVGLAVARYLEVPLVYEIRSFLEQTWTGDLERAESGEYFHRRYAQEVRCLTEADHVITIAESMRSEIVGRGIDPGKISVVPNVVDIERFAPRPKSQELIRKYRLDGGSTIGYISNLGFREGIENLIRGIAYLRKAGLDVQGLIVGDGPERAHLEALVEELELSQHVVLTGHIANEEIEDHYALIDLFVIPRIDDRAARLVTPLKPLEAMAMNIPVIAADLPALRELVMPGERGEVFRPSDPEHLAEVAGSLLVDESTRLRYAEAGRSWVVSDRTLDANARRYRTILDSLFGSAP